MGRLQLRLVKIGVWAIVATASPALGACPIERARYVMSHDRQFTAGFVPIKKYDGWPTDLAIFVHSANTKATYWFVLDRASLSRIDLIPTTDVRTKAWRPPQERRLSVEGTGYLATDVHRIFLTGIPDRGSKPPRYFLLPDLPELLRYHFNTREDAPWDFFSLNRCAGTK
jgi:hypothetical protein